MQTKVHKEPGLLSDEDLAKVEAGGQATFKFTELYTGLPIPWKGELVKLRVKRNSRKSVLGVVIKTSDILEFIGCATTAKVKVRKANDDDIRNAPDCNPKRTPSFWDYKI